MNIAINALYLGEKEAGINRYLTNLLDCWSREFPQYKYYLYFRNQIPKERFLERPCFTKKALRDTPFFQKPTLWENFVLPYHLFNDRKKFDIFFSPTYRVPLITPAPKIAVTIFDISPRVHPEWYRFRTRYPVYMLSKRAAKVADVVFAISEFDKSDIIKFYNTPEEKVKVTYLAAGPEFNPADQNDYFINETKRKYGIQKRYILYVSRIIRRKVQDVVIRAFGKFQEKYSDVNLVLVGRNETYPYLDIKKIIQENDKKGRIIWLEYVPGPDLVALYQGASAFIYMSLYDGEGIPLREAMACGIPVITTENLQEVVGNAGYLIKNCTNENEIKTAMEEVLGNEKLRTRMIQNGLERTKLFSWEKCARETMFVFEQLLKP